MLRCILFTTMFLIVVSCSNTDPVGIDSAYRIELVSPKEGGTYTASEPLPVEWTNNMPASSKVVFELLHGTTIVTKSILTSTPGKVSIMQSLSDVTISDSTYSVRIYSQSDNAIIASSGHFSITVKNSTTNTTYEPNDTRKTATRVKVGDNQLHTISLSDDDWFAIPVTATDSVELMIATYYATAFYTCWASEVSSGIAPETYYGGTNFTKVISGVTDTLFVRVTKQIPSWSKITGPSSNEHDYYVTVRDLRDQSQGTLETNLKAKSYQSGDTIHMVVNNSLDGTLYLYRDASTYQVRVETFDGKAVSYIIPKYITSGSYYFQFEPRGGTEDLTSVIFSIVGTSVDDVYEDDDNMKTAKILRTGESQQRTLTADDHDYIKIPTVKNRDIRITIVTPDSITAYTATVQGSFVEIDNDLRPVKTATGYQFLVKYSSLDTIGLILWRPDKAVISEIGYTVTAEALEKQTNIILDKEPLKTEYRPGDTISLNPEYTTPFVNQFRFELYSGDTRIATISEKDSDMDWVIPFSLAGGKYQIKITAIGSNYPDSTFTPSFTVVSAVVNDDVNEPNNDSTTATVITQFNTPLNGTALYGDIDWFSFPLDKNHRYSLSVTPRDSLSKVNVNLNVPGWILNYNGPEQIIPNVAGNVFVKIYAASAGKGGSYTLLVKRFAKDSLLIFSKPEKGTVYKAGDTLIHSIKNTNWLEANAFGEDVEVYLYKGNKQMVQLKKYEIKDTIGEKIIIPAGHLSGNDYYFKAVAYEDSGIHSTSPFFTITGAEADSYEPNNSKDSATLLPASFLNGISIAGTLHQTLTNGTFNLETTSDVDWFGISLAPKTTVIVQSKGVKISTTDRGTGFLKAISNTSTKEAVINFSMAPGSGEYTLTALDDMEPNNTRETSVALPVKMVNSSDTLYRHFIDDDDVDWYSIELGAGSYSVTTKLIDASNESYDETNITAYVGNTKLNSGTDSVKIVMDTDTTVFLEYVPKIFWSDAGVTRYSIVIKTIP